MDYVYANNDGLVLNEVQGGSVMMTPNDVWDRDHPFVQARRDLFSATPVRVITLAGLQQLPATPVEETRKARRA